MEISKIIQASVDFELPTISCSFFFFFSCVYIHLFLRRGSNSFKSQILLSKISALATHQDNQTKTTRRAAAERCISFWLLKSQQGIIGVLLEPFPWPGNLAALLERAWRAVPGTQSTSTAKEDEHVLLVDPIPGNPSAGTPPGIPPEDSCWLALQCFQIWEQV